MLEIIGSPAYLPLPYQTQFNLSINILIQILDQHEFKKDNNKQVSTLMIRQAPCSIVLFSERTDVQTLCEYDNQLGPGGSLIIITYYTSVQFKSYPTK